MSPIIELQRRLVEAGRIRAGEKGEKGEPRKLDKWRLTSKDRQRLELASSLWGGEVREWEGHAGEFELYTDTAQLPITLIPGQLPTTWYELWSKGGCQRRCDGQHELISDSACLCGEERECKPHTRLSVLLPDLPGLGSWMLSSTGWNAAAELAGAADLLQRASAQGVLIPARLRLEQRVSVSQGQTRRFAVPVIDVDVSFRELLGTAALPSAERAALPAGYVPITGNGGDGVSLAAGLEQAENQQAVRTARSAAPIPPSDDIEFGAAPVPVDDPGAPQPPPAEGSSPTSSETSATAAPQEDFTLEEIMHKLNALVGSLRKDGHISTEQIYSAVAGLRETDVESLITAVDGRSEAGRLSWAKLRDALFEEEARNLHGRLARLWATTREGAAA